jgi:hypothetical protein
VLEHSELVSRYNRAAEPERLTSERQRRKRNAETFSGLADLAPTFGTIYRIKLIPAELWAAARSCWPL